jgi:alpha-L-fucosidase
MPNHIVHKGKIVEKEGKMVLLTKFTPQSPEIEVPMEELLEDFQDQGVEITIAPRHHEPPIYQGLVKNWEEQMEDIAEPDYPFCSEKGRERFLDMKFGLMVHWGLYTHLGLLESWSMNARSAPQWFKDIYYTMWQVFNPVKFDAEEWANIVKRAGMQFIQITTKHHEGFCLWDTKTKTKALHRIGSQSGSVVEPVNEVEINFSVMDSPFKRDIIGELSRAFHKHGLGWGIYFSHIDWNDPNFRWDEANRSYDPTYTEKTHPEQWRAFIERERQQLIELFTNYGELCQVFFDGTWFGLAWEDMKKLVKEIRKLQPDCMFNDRGIGPYGDFNSPERWIPVEEGQGRKARMKLWQVCDPIGTHWSWVPEEVYKDKHTLLHNLIDVVAKGGTYVFDQGPMNDGRFPQEAIDILEYMGRWLQVNGEAIYATRPWKRYRDSETQYYTRSKDQKTVYCIHIGWPTGKVTIPDINVEPGSQIQMLGVKGACPWTQNGKNLVIDIPEVFNSQIPCEYAFAFKIAQKLS